jgi:colanic acid/amylovoran biosynthesis glycosyltransferase
LIEPFPESSQRLTVVHVRTHAFSNRTAPFVRQTVLGLRPYVNNVVLTPETDCENPSDIHIETIRLQDLRHPFSHFKMAHYLRERYPTVSLVMGHFGNGTRVARTLAKMLGVPLLGIFGGSDVNLEWQNEKYRDAYEELAQNPSAHFLTVANYLRDKLIQYGVPAQRLSTWHRGVDLQKFHVPTRPGKPKLRLVISARFFEVKGHEYMLRALAELNRRRRRAELVLLGDGPLEVFLRALANDLGIAADVHFIGRVSHEEVYRHLQEADIYVHPSVTCTEGRVEGVPNAIMEAHATGLPVVATRHGGITEVVLDNQTGFLVPERDPEALALRIGQLCEFPELRAKMGARGREHVEREFNLEAQSRRLAARIFHTIEAGKLFSLRGWPMHQPAVGSLTRPTRASLAYDAESLLARLLHPSSASQQTSTGPIQKLFKRAAWAVAASRQTRAI